VTSNYVPTVYWTSSIGKASLKRVREFLGIRAGAANDYALGTTWLWGRI
jgi:hypothetical protein